MLFFKTVMLECRLMKCVRTVGIMGELVEKDVISCCLRFDARARGTIPSGPLDQACGCAYRFSF